MSPTRTPEDYARDVGAAQVALDKAKRLLAVRNVIDGIQSDPLCVDVGLVSVVVEAREQNASVELARLPRDLTTRMHAAIADILADYLAQLENE